MTPAGRLTVRPKRTLLQFLVCVVVASGQRAPSPPTAKTDSRSNLCSLASFPADIKSRFKEEFGAWKVQEPQNLSPSARQRWESEKALECPGIAIGRFENKATPSYAVLLVPVERPGAAYKLLVFSRKGDQPGHVLTILEQSTTREAQNYFIHTIRIADLFSEESRNNFNARSKDGILLVDAAEKEYEADVYFWTNGRYQQESVDH